MITVEDLPTCPFNSSIAFALTLIFVVLFAIAALLSPMNLRFSIAIVPATLMSFSFCSTRLVRPFKSPLTPSTLTFTLLIAVVFLAILVVLLAIFVVLFSTLPLILVICFLISLITVED